MICEQPNSDIGSNPWPPTGDVGASAIAPEPNDDEIVTLA
jgi:hypothetical protein